MSSITLDIKVVVTESEKGVTVGCSINTPGNDTLEDARNSAAILETSLLIKEALSSPEFNKRISDLITCFEEEFQASQAVNSTDNTPVH